MLAPVVAAILLGGTRSTAQQQPATVQVGFAVAGGGTARTGIAVAADALASESLVSIGQDGRPAARLAASWSPTPDRKGWTFSLSPSIRFHDSQPADATVVAALLQAAVRNPDELVISPRLAEIEQITGTRDHRLVLRTRNGRLSLLEELAQVPLKRGDSGGSLGAFHLESSSEEGFTARRIDGYYRGAPSVASIEFKVFRSPRAAWAAMMRGEIDALYEVSREAVEFVERDSGVRVYSFLRPYPATLFFNVRAPQLRQKRVRRALSHAVDREAIVRVAYRGRGRVANGPLSPEHWASEKLAVSSGFNPQAATTALSELNAAGPFTKRLAFKCLVVSGAETQPFERLALMLQKQFFDIGVDMELELVTPREFLRRVSAGDFEAGLFEFGARVPSALYPFWHSPQSNTEVWVRHGYSAADRELDAMYAAESEEDLRTALAAVYGRMADDPPAIFIAWPEVARAASTRFSIPVEPGTDIMGANMRLWRPAAAGGTR